jgi:hypothetical protein
MFSVALCLRGAFVVGAAVFLLTQSSPTCILFVGNSLTYSNDLPSMVCAMARSAGKQVTCESVAKPDYGLEEHWNDRAAPQAIARGWDVVVLQQGPSALPESRRLLIDYTRRFDAEIKKAGARTALFMAWPSLARRGDFPGKLPLYGPDGFHPSDAGTYLSALVIYEQLFAAPPPALPVPAGAQASADLLRKVAHDTVVARR